MKRMKENWVLGFLGFLGFLGIPGIITRDWKDLLWLAWFIWFIHFVPQKRSKSDSEIVHSGFTKQEPFTQQKPKFRQTSEPEFV